ncbi:heavy metal response regulator transcription factor [Thorsellia anophelis]|uniref:Two-component system, OmpR family, copper resistance phosphate regulon response regulator CusR n=1 Tax=Thorsellia anophelis DSM 18579 TaxID=1123402 RepID=A0A1I0B3T0_9GAMM|nr:heavy metal response regulator transcription factor [Thorsellia anophelis]SET01513.1 two-component system, OmpR family, copper resistance phosphate regulon response regulator CusR [Thorsellia anophelis DSM 18579]
MKLLIIEDEIKTGQYLKQGLEESGFVVDLATDGEAGLHLAQSEHYDILVIDIMLPKLNGWAITHALRKNGFLVPILILTARDSLEDKVKSFEISADDYLAKPFAFAELLARIKSLIRRSQLTNMTPYTANVSLQENVDKYHHYSDFTIADLKIDRLKHLVYRDGRIIHLTPKEYLLLELLALHQGEVLTRAVIASRVWDINFDSDTNVIDVAIKRLRHKIDHGYEVKLIHTKRGMGYFLDVVPPS